MALTEKPMGHDTITRVAKLEVSVDSLHDEVGAVKSEVRAGNQAMQTGISDINASIGRKNQTNWSQVFAGAAILVALIGAVGTAWVKPLQEKDEVFDRRLDRVQDISGKAWEASIRADERAKDSERRLSVIEGKVK